MTKRYSADARRDSLCFDILQNMEPRIAQAFFWNFTSRSERREAILNWKAYRDIGGFDPTPPETPEVAQL